MIYVSDNLLTRSNHPIIVLGWVLTLVLAIMLVWTIQSTVITSSPVTQTDAVAFVTKTDSAKLLVDVRHYMSSSTTTLYVFRSIYPYGRENEMLVMDGGIIAGINGEFSVIKSGALPNYMSGKWCSRATIHWKPMLSLRTHEIPTQDICFEVQK